MITGLRRWIARAVALLVTVLTLGRVTVSWDGVRPVGVASDERGAVTTIENRARCR